METTEDLQTDTVLQSPEIERSKTCVSDQRIHILLDTRTIARIEEHLTRLGKGLYSPLAPPLKKARYFHRIIPQMRTQE